MLRVRGEHGTVPVRIIDDHPLVAAALQAALQRFGVDAQRIDPAAAATLAERLDRSPAGLVILDLDLGDSGGGDSGGGDSGGGGDRVPDGTDLVPRIRAAGWEVMMLTGSRDRARIAAAVAAGAMGWLAKTTPFDDVVATVHAAARGERVFDPGRRAELVAEHHAAQEAHRDLDRRWSRLTPREREVLGCLVDGKRVADIAREFVVSPATVRTQVKSVLSKLEVSSQLEAVALARRAR